MSMHEGKTLILAYHCVNRRQCPLCTNPNAFEKQLSLLKRRKFQNMSLSDYIDVLKAGEKVHSGRYVVITFDDGWGDNYTDAFPILQKYGYTATIFLTVTYIGEKKDYLAWGQVAEMQRAGFEFGSHTLTHPHLTQIPVEEAWQEIKKSKEELEKQLGKEISAFCYPYGDYNRDIIELVKKAGYQGAVVTPPSGRCEKSIYTIRRVGIYSSDTILSFRVKTSRLTQVIAFNEALWSMAKRFKRWMRI